jgi:hypothetical protein
MSVTQAQRVFCIDHAWISRGCAKAGLKLGRNGTAGFAAGEHERRVQRDRAIANGAARGRTMRELAREFEVHEETIRRACAAQGVKPVDGRLDTSLQRRRTELRVELGGKGVKKLTTPGPGLPEAHTKVRRLLLTTSLPLKEVGRRTGYSFQRVYQISRLLVTEVARIERGRT